jgi:hypothetical protein
MDEAVLFYGVDGPTQYGLVKFKILKLSCTSVCNLQPATCNLQPATCNTKQATSHFPHASSLLYHTRTLVVSYLLPS